MKNALTAFKKNIGAYPNRLIFYRYGVGDGQVQGVCVPGIEQIKAAIKSAGVDCKIMYTNTSKRVKSRIFGDRCCTQTPGKGNRYTCKEREDFDYCEVICC